MTFRVTQWQTCEVTFESFLSLIPYPPPTMTKSYNFCLTNLLRCILFSSPTAQIPLPNSKKTQIPVGQFWEFDFSSLFSLPTSGPLHLLMIGEGKALPHFSSCSLIVMWYFPGNADWLFRGLIFSGPAGTFFFPSAVSHTDVMTIMLVLWLLGLFLTSWYFGVSGDTLSLSFVTDFIHKF